MTFAVIFILIAVFVLLLKLIKKIFFAGFIIILLGAVAYWLGLLKF